MNEKDVKGFARLLEDAGYSGAIRLITDDLLPVALKHGISLYDAAKRYADTWEEQDTSWYQLGEAFTKIDRAKLAELNIHEPLKVEMFVTSSHVTTALGEMNRAGRNRERRREALRNFVSSYFLTDDEDLILKYMSAIGKKLSERRAAQRPYPIK
jgi:hypothetical protein